MLSPLGPMPASFPAPAASSGAAQVRHIAQEFEAVLGAAMLKEGLKSATQTSVDGEDGGGSTYMELTCEQLAAFIGRQGVLGIADQIVQSLSPEMNGTSHANE